MDFEQDENGMVTVRATADNVIDNGHRYDAGKVFHMHKDLVPAHVAAGQVETVKTGEKQQTPPRDKQVTGSKNK